MSSPGPAPSEGENEGPDAFEKMRRIVERAIANAGSSYHTGQLALDIRDTVLGEQPEL